eukprot:CAMPEP_0204156146 /NCGR_PEP_ID=MMETSP0361-20130328/30213_1 /ASSEMBLY_ACC=CAM_ASM_000343 /TAXON_ID=268821 /ORGANISM="Scrippsiella Hangoei, Strain SHTV-5" /LENGTH=53 /DNA_ID=CAMNT_0051111739 /DNA_START=46 /DNA_END=204 /DNA_ORIENTATION=-
MNQALKTGTISNVHALPVPMPNSPAFWFTSRTCTAILPLTSLSDSSPFWISFS